MKRLRNIALWLFVASYLVIVMGAMSNVSNKILCTSIAIHIDDSTSAFVTRGDIMNILEKYEAKLIGYPLMDINSEELERLILRHTAVKSVQVYKTANGKINFQIQQRKPLVRVFAYNNSTYYIDTEGKTMPASYTGAADVMVVNGNIPVYPGNKISVRNYYKNSSINKKKYEVLKDIYYLVNYIQSSDFWSNQIVQIYYNSEGDFELIPRVGGQIIVLGKVEELDKKFNKLMTLYKEGFNNIGWNEYYKINLKYDNQVVCTKR